jgi:hypothetical protein
MTMLALVGRAYGKSQRLAPTRQSRKEPDGRADLPSSLIALLPFATVLRLLPWPKANQKAMNRR